MIPLPFTWSYALVFWPVFVWAFIPEVLLVGKSSAKAFSSPEDRGSIRVLILTGGFAAAVALFLAFAIPQALIISFRVSWFFCGVIFLIAGSMLRRHCFRILGPFFTGAVTIQPGHRVIDRGAYRWVRHPSYSAALLMFVGVGLAFGSWLSLAVLSFACLAAYSYRARIEERAMLASLGEPYRQFMTSRKRFIPFVY